MWAWRIHLALCWRALAVVAVQTGGQIQRVLMIPLGGLPCRRGMAERTVIGVGGEMR